ncbi:MAG: hypothetical protein RI922_1720 [Bacteroidota bacterium]|jgi:hypothetical protein
MTRNIIILALFTSVFGCALAQWPNNSLLPLGNNTLFGTAFNSPINIYTNNNQTAQFSTGYSLGPGIIPSANMGDGLRIIPRTQGCGSPSLPGTGALDLWTGRFNITNGERIIFNTNPSASNSRSTGIF